MLTFDHLTEKLISLGFKETEAKIFACIIINGKIGATEIARIIKTSSQNVSMMVQRLIEKHLIVKERAKYMLSSPLEFMNFADEESRRTENLIQEKKQTAAHIAEMINMAYLEASGKPVVRLLNLDEWRELKKEIVFTGDDKILRIIRGKRTVKTNDKQKALIYLEDTRRKKGIKYEIITPFLNEEKDINKDSTTYYKINSSVFSFFNIDIYIKNDFVAIGERISEDKKDKFNVITIKNKKITNSFIELFEYLKKTSKNTL